MAGTCYYDLLLTRRATFVPGSRSRKLLFTRREEGRRRTVLTLGCTECEGRLDTTVAGTNIGRGVTEEIPKMDAATAGVGPTRLGASGRAQLSLGVDVPRPLPVLDQRARGTAFIGLRVERVLNSPETTGMSFWSLNPYVGCEFGCSYCYARDTHRWLTERAGLPNDGVPARDRFEREIFVKLDVASVLRRTLDPAKIGRATLLIGTATDPYQPAERRFGVTRWTLEALADFRDLAISITTKSPLVGRDVELLRRLSRRNEVSVSISVISLDPELVRRLEPRSPLPHARIRALRTLARAGVDVGVLIAPIIPGLTDGWGSLGGLMAAAKEAGAGYAVGSALRLGDVARAGLLPLIEREFPHLAARYHRRYRGRHDAGADYLAALRRRLRTLQQIHGFPLDDCRSADESAPPSRGAGMPPAAERPSPVLSFDFGDGRT